MFCKKCVLRNLTKFTGKHLRQNLFFNKVAVEHLWWLTPLVAASKSNNFIQSNAAKDKKSFFNISINILIKVAAKLYIMNYSRVVIILFSTGL